MAHLTRFFRSTSFPVPRSWFRPTIRRTRRSGRRAWQPIVAAEVLETRTLLSALAVTTPVDIVSDGDGVLSLREAILIANDDTGATSFDGISSGDAADTIQFDASLASQTILLLGAQLPLITSDVAIIGLGADQLGIDAQHASRIFEVGVGTTVEISGLTLTGGHSSGFGGAILNFGTLTVADSILRGNSAERSGGAVRNNGSLVVTDSTISGNSAGSSHSGGAVINFSAMEIVRSVFSSNSAGYRGGGIFNTFAGTLSLTDTEISDNSAGFQSGGIWNNGALRVTDTAISRNSAGGNGGGVTNFSSGTLTMTGSTVAGNQAGSNGGGIENVSGTMTVADSVVSGNTAGADGGGVWNDGAVELIDSLLSGNSAGAFAGAILNSGTLTIAGTALTGNSVARSGGGIRNDGWLTMTDSTVSGNSAGGSSSGGGIINFATLDVTGSAFSRNTAGFRGGGIFNGGRATLTLADSTVSENSAGSQSGGIWNNASLTVIGSTITANSAGNGGGITNFVAGALTISGSTLTDNVAGTNGGAIENASGTLNLTGSVLSGNSAGQDGGGIWNDGRVAVDDTMLGGNSAARRGGGVYNAATEHELTITDSTLAENSAEFQGGGLFNLGGVVLVTGSTFRGNSAVRAGGGGLTNNGGMLIVEECTFAGNTAARFGGGVLNQGSNALLAVINSTFSGNSAGISGGGISNFFGTATVTNSTIVLNRADADGDGTGGGGGIHAGQFTTLNNTIVAGNVRGASGSDTPHDLSGGHVDPAGAHNLIGDAGSSGGLGDRVNGNIVGNGGVGVIDLSTVLNTALADNGGPTLTHALVADSTAINAGNNALAVDANRNPLATDQRGPGFPRVFGGTVDIGAYELQNVAPKVGDSAQTGAEDNPLAFSTADFAAHFIDLDGDSLRAVRIETLPENGTLELHGAPVSAGQVISAANLDVLVFVPALNFHGETSFTWTATDGIAGFAATPATITLSIRSTFQQAADLQAQVDALVAQGVLQEGQGDSLKAKLDLNGNPKRDAAKIGDFIDQVNAFVSSGTLTQDHADGLLAAAEVLLISVTTA